MLCVRDLPAASWLSIRSTPQDAVTNRELELAPAAMQGLLLSSVWLRRGRNGESTPMAILYSFRKRRSGWIKASMWAALGFFVSLSLALPFVASP